LSELEDLINKENKGEIERQLERLGFFTFNGLNKYAEKINELEVKLKSLINALNLDQSLNQELFDGIQKTLKERMINEGSQLDNGVKLRFDTEDFKKKISPPVNCSERLHICKAVCCKLQFPLSAEEIEKGKIKWDLGIPYQIRQKDNGYCTHNKADCSCSVYEDRPRICIKFSCVNDARIWKDFEKMELNKEWINSTLKKEPIKFEKSDLESVNINDQE
jgi:hypothetical protein